MDPLSQAIDRTVRWFALFSHPLTAFEVWKWLHAPGAPASLEEVRSRLESDADLRMRLSQFDGHFAPAGKAEEFVRVRRERHAVAIGKFRQLRRASLAWARVPGVRAVAAANTLAWWNTREDSDIDVLVVADDGALWSARALLVTPYALAGKRPGGRRAASGAFDFSFFLAASSLDLSRFALPGGDPYLAYWTASLVPVHDPEGLIARIWDANAWARETLPNAYPWPQPAVASRRAPCLPAAFDRAAERLQRAYFPQAIRERLNKDTCVVADEGALKFHVNDRREAYRAAWQEDAYVA